MKLSATDTPPRPAPGWRIAIPGVLLFLLIPIYGVSLAASKVGMFHDDGIYVATAKSMAEGNGYRIAGYPAEMPQTKYPPLLPALLSLAWRVNPNFPQNEWLLKSVPMLALLAWALACVWFLRTRAGVELNGALWVLVFTLTNHYCLVTSTSIMSDALYGALVIAALAYLGDACERSDGSRAVIVAALFAGGAYYARTAGICLVLAGVAGSFIGKRFKQAALFGAICGAAVAAWMAWQSQPSGVSTMIERYYTAQNYRDLNSLSGAHTAETIGTIAFHNALTLLMYPITSILQIPISSASGFLVTLAPSCAFWLVVGRGVRRSPPSLRPAVLFAAITMGMLLFYAWLPTRFLLPVLPILLLLAYLGRPRRLPSIGMPLLAVLPVAGAFLFAQNTWKHDLSDFRSSFWLAAQGDRAEQVSWGCASAVYSWIRQHTADDAVILANYDPALSLNTGRASIRPDAASGLELFYGIRRPLPEKIAEFELLVQKLRPRYLAEIANDDGVEPDFNRMLEALKASGRLRLVKHIAPRYNVYEIAPDKPQADPLRKTIGATDP